MRCPLIGCIYEDTSLGKLMLGNVEEEVAFGGRLVNNYGIIASLCLL